MASLLPMNTVINTTIINFIPLQNYLLIFTDHTTASTLLCKCKPDRDTNTPEVSRYTAIDKSQPNGKDTHYRKYEPQMLKSSGIPQRAELKYKGPGQHMHAHHYPTCTSYNIPNTICSVTTPTHSRYHLLQVSTPSCIQKFTLPPGS